MVKYTPTDEFDFNNIPLTGVLIPGTTTGYVSESKYIQGGYIVVSTTEERDDLLDKTIYEDKKLTVGTPVYVAAENKTYRYMGEDVEEVWSEDTADLQTVMSDLSALSELVRQQGELIDQKANQSDLNATNSSMHDLLNIMFKMQEDIDTRAKQEDFLATTNELSTQISQKANQAEVDTIQATKADAEKVYDKAEVDSMLAAIEKDINWDNTTLTTYDVGGLKAGSAVEGRSLKEILSMILYGIELIEPTYEEPEIEISVNNAVGISSNPLTIEGTVYFNRGRIFLRKGEQEEFQNCRSGVAQSIVVKDESGHLTTIPVSMQEEEREKDFSFNYTNPAVEVGVHSFEASINYKEGPQPIDSFGKPVGSPLPAGAVSTTFEVIGLTNTWTGSEGDLDGVVMDQIDEEIITDDTPESASKSGMFIETDSESDKVIASGYQLTVPSWTMSEDRSTLYSPIVLIADGTPIAGVKVWDEGQGSWEWYRGSNAQESLNTWIPDGTVEKTYNNNQTTILYRIYKCDSNIVFETPLHFRFYVLIQKGV